MGIKEVPIDTNSWCPGEKLSNAEGYTHITIAYDISGERGRIDRRIDDLVERERCLQKIDIVNTVIYWQVSIDHEDDDKILYENIKDLLKERLLELFVDRDNLSRATVTAYCMVGNIRAFAFELDA